MKQTLVDISRTIDARLDTVWDIISTPEGFSKWMGGDVTFASDVGSPFEGRFPQFQTVIRGEVLEFDSGAHRIALSWGIETGPQAAYFPAASSRVELSLTAEAPGTLIQVRHSALPTAKEAGDHEAGWRFNLSRLSLIANREDLSATLGPAMDAWFAAWNETDSERRAELLARCCAPDIEFRDEYTEASGRDLLSLHIGNSQRFRPGWRIESAGPVVICRGEALCPWRYTGPEGAAVEGTNHVTATPDGTISRVTGFPSALGS